MPDRPLFEQLRANAPQLSVGVLTADWMSLGTDLSLLEYAGIGLLHFDVMDGEFCPTMTLGAPVVSKVRTPMLKDIHLMVEDPLDKTESFVAAGADMITVHVESTPHIHRVLQSLGQFINANEPGRGLIRGVALNPGTALETIEPLLDELEFILLLAVNPGWGGQKFASSTGARLARLKKMVQGRVLLGIDGGITRENIASVARMEPDIIVAGSAIFDGGAPVDNLHFMLSAIGK